MLKNIKIIPQKINVWVAHAYSVHFFNEIFGFGRGWDTVQILGVPLNKKHFQNKSEKSDKTLGIKLKVLIIQFIATSFFYFFFFLSLPSFDSQI